MQLYGSSSAGACFLQIFPFNPSQIHTVSPSDLPISIQFFCSDRTWRSEILFTSSVLSVTDSGGILPLVKRPEKYAFIEKNSEKMCGKYFITREEKEKGWQEIMAILQRRGEPFKTSKIFQADTVLVIANSRSMCPRPSPCAGATCCPTASESLTPTAKPPRAGRCSETACVNGVA